MQSRDGLPTARLLRTRSFSSCSCWSSLLCSSMSMLTNLHGKNTWEHVHRHKHGENLTYSWNAPFLRWCTKQQVQVLKSAREKKQRKSYICTFCFPRSLRIFFVNPILSSPRQSCLASSWNENKEALSVQVAGLFRMWFLPYLTVQYGRGGGGGVLLQLQAVKLGSEAQSRRHDSTK